MDARHRQTSNNPLSVFIRPYKTQYYYWEFIILSRRIILIFIVTVFNSNISLLILIFILGIFLILQHEHKPFIFNEINQIEEILLLTLILVMSTQAVLSNKTQTSNHNYTLAISLFSLFIIAPFILLIYYICLSIHKIKKGTFQNKNYSLDIFKQRIKYLILSIIVWYSLSSDNSSNDARNIEQNMNQLDDYHQDDETNACNSYAQLVPNNKRTKLKVSALNETEMVSNLFVDNIDTKDRSNTGLDQFSSQKNTMNKITSTHL
eukprot:468323_1